MSAGVRGRGVRWVLAGVAFWAVLGLLCGGGVAWGVGLADGRQWELVSPPEKDGTQVETLNGGEVQAAEDGSAIAYFTTGAVTGETPAEGNTELVSQVLSSRGSGGWGSRDIATGDASTVGKALGEGKEYRLFSSDLSLGLVEQLAFIEQPPLLAPDASERTEYLHDDAPVTPGPGEASDYAAAQGNGEASAARGEPFGEPGYLPLLTGADTEPGVRFGTRCVSASAEPLACTSRYGENNVEDATGDLSRVVLRSRAGLTGREGATPAAEASGAEGSLYEWTEGRLELVSVLPDGKQAGVPFPKTEEETSSLEGEGPALGRPGNGSGPTVVRHAISNDGSRVIWSDVTPGGEAHPGRNQSSLYMRDVSKGETVRLDVAQPQPGVPEPAESEAVFQTASEDGSRVFFTDTEKLTVEATADEESIEEHEPDLYVCEMHEGDGRLACALKDLTVPVNPAKHADVQGEFAGANEGVVLGASEEEGAEKEDGAYVYFVALGVLSGVNGEGREPVEGQDNLYVAHYNGSEWEEHPTFIATLSSEDAHDWAMEQGFLEQVTSRVSPNGRFLEFMSDRELTGYKNVDANSPVGEPHADEEVFEYDAASKQLACASCNPSGRPPVGVFDPGELIPGKGTLVVDGRTIWVDRWLAGSVPGWDALTASRSVYQPRYLADSGRLFFDSPDMLVPDGSNSKEDVYEFEPEGVGPEEARCARGVDNGFDVFKEQRAFVDEEEPGRVGGVESGGCVALMSSGVSLEESAFMDASASGDDVFFITTAQLGSQDVDTSFDMYDAHECSVAACFPEAPAPAAACETGVSCRAAGPGPTVVGAPPSQTFSGAGNVPGLAVAVVKPKTAAQIRAEDLAKALKACHAKRSKRKRIVCEAQARKRYGPPEKAKKPVKKPAGKGGGR